MPLEKMRLCRIEAEARLLAGLEVDSLGGCEAENRFPGGQKFDNCLGAKPLDKRDPAGEWPFGIQNKMLRANTKPRFMSLRLFT